MYQNSNTPVIDNPLRRIHWWYALILVVASVFIIKLFYLQIIQHDYYQKAALKSQLKEYEIPAERGLIEAHDGSQIIPIVLNEKLYTVFADPKYIQDPLATAKIVAGVIGGDASQYQKSMQATDTRYAVLSKKVPKDQKDKLDALKLKGVGTRESAYRTYPQGDLAAQVLGFVNDDGQGTYGIEEALNADLTGQPGEVKAITDVNGVPLAASGDNVQKAPQSGKNVVLTLDVSMQDQLEQILQQGVQKDKASGGSALILDPNSGAVKAMANFPSYSPANFSQVSDPTLFNNNAVSNPIEVGSTMKTLTTAAALDQGVIQPGTTYYDPSHWTVDGFTITNIEEDGGPGTKSIGDILNLSLNTGATWMLMQMGGGQINKKARDTWHDYMVNHYQFGKAPGIEQGYVAPGVVPDPDNGYALDLTYANTAFGQAMTATPLQMAAALSSVLNGGTYYQPHLVDQTIDANGKKTVVSPKVVKTNVVGPQVGQELIPLMQYVVQQHHIVPGFDQTHYIVGGKTGTAQIAKPTGGYYDNEYNGTYVGFVGGNKVQYVIVVFVYQPKIGGYAGSAAAQPIFAGLAHMLLDNGYVTPKS